MASSYALPTTNGGSSFQHHVHHGYSRSYSGASLAPDQAGSNGYVKSNGYPVIKKAVSTNGLFTHAEGSRETSPLPSPGTDEYKTPFGFNSYASDKNASLYTPSPSRGHIRMKSRPRGESDLGRPADVPHAVYKPTLHSIPPASTSWFSLPEALTALLIPLPFLLASAAYSSITHEELSGGSHELPAYARMQRGASGQGLVLPKQKFSSDSGLVEACTLASATLLFVGVAAKVRSSLRQLDRRKDQVSYEEAARAVLTASSAKTMALRTVSLVLPFYAAMQIGGLRTGLVMLTSTAAGLSGGDTSFRRPFFEWKHLLSTRLATMLVIALSMVLDFSGCTFHAPLTHMLSGYIALAVSALLLPSQLPTTSSATSRPASKVSTPTSSKSPWLRNGLSRSAAASPLTASVADVNLTLISALLMCALTAVMWMLWPAIPSIQRSALIFGGLSVAAMCAGVMVSQPQTLQSPHRAGLGLGCLMTASCAFMYSPALWPGTICNGGLSALSYLGVLYDTTVPGNESPAREHTHHHHEHAKNDEGSSAFTKFLMNYIEPGTLIHGILSEKDSRRIAYFTLLNFGFMIVQGIYGYISGSLGLLSDTVHMFFDCLGLVVGLGAAVASKWPTSPEKPYGWGKLNTLAGFGNGVFLMLVSVEFVWEAIEGIVEGKELRHVQELLVVSVAGFLVNMVGLLAFGHAHAGHDHGHSHGHSHEHSHEHSHKHEHEHEHEQDHHDHTHTNGHAHHHACDHDHKALAPHAHAHDHHNENMHGIFLHVAADAGGSLAVIISTALTLWKPWYLWDPLATIIIAILIFAAAVPLVTSSGQKLLLVIPDELEYGIKNTLQELNEMRGVIGYAAPRFWVDDREDAALGGHDHHHHGHDSGTGKQKVMGVIHIIAAHSADLEDVRLRVEDYMHDRRMDVTVHVEREADGTCWCGGRPPKSG
jgi:solute carrier family 30 (zinc transporter), member 5/7